MNLSIRLQKIADFVPEGGVVADVGTDHGHLPIYLVQKQKNPAAIAMDVRPGPLSRAQQAIAVCGLKDQIETRLADGLGALKPGEANTVTIAGMGGALIQKIMIEGSHMWDSVEHWILSPQSELRETRHWLSDNGFAILKEDMVLDAGKYYVVMDVVRGSFAYQQEYEYSYGGDLIAKAHPVLREFLLLEQKKRLEILEKLSKSEHQKARCEELKAELEEIHQVLLKITE